MNPQAVNALAALMHDIRPEWDPPGCVAALRRCPDLPIAELGIAALRYTADPQNLTPGNLPNLDNRAWDNDGYPPCPRHPHYRARRTNGECGACYADRNAATPDGTTPDRGGRPIPAADRQTITAALHRATPDEATTSRSTDQRPEES